MAEERGSYGWEKGVDICCKKKLTREIGPEKTQGGKGGELFRGVI